MFYLDKACFSVEASDRKVGPGTLVCFTAKQMTSKPDRKLTVAEKKRDKTKKNRRQNYGMTA